MDESEKKGSDTAHNEGAAKQTQKDHEHSTAKDAKEHNNSKDAKEHRNSKDAKKHNNSKDAKEHNNSKDAKEHNKSKDAKEHKNSKDDKNHNNSKDAKDHKNSKDAIEHNNSKDPDEGEPDDGSCSIIQEYNNIIKNIKQQNLNLERIKKQMSNATNPLERKCIERLFNVEEEKLNEELVKAMILQTKCPYQKWAEIPVATNIKEDNGGCAPGLLIKKVKKQAGNADKSCNCKCHK